MIHRCGDYCIRRIGLHTLEDDTMVLSPPMSRKERRALIALAVGATVVFFCLALWVLR